jgi:hypothetical protein
MGLHLAESAVSATAPVRSGMAGVLCAILLLCAAVATPRAQIVVEEDIVTDSVDVFATREQDERTSGLVLLQSLILPGLGHYSLGYKNKALGYFLAEAAFLFGALYTNASSGRLQSSSREFAARYAWVEGGSGANEQFWQDITYADGSEGYNRSQELNRAPEEKYLSDNLQWRWPDESYRDHYEQLREGATRFRVASTFMIGAMVLNRAVSFVMVRRETRHKGIRSMARASSFGSQLSVRGEPSLLLTVDF